MKQTHSGAALHGSLFRILEDELEARDEDRLAFEVRSKTAVPGASGQQRPLVGAFTDGDWERLLALAREYGFDPDLEYEDVLRPAPGETGELQIAAAQELAVALSEALRKETPAAGDTGEEKENTSWVYAPDLGWEQSPVLWIGASRKPEMQVGWVHARQLGELAETGPVKISRADEPG